MSFTAPEVHVVSGNLISAMPSVTSSKVLDDILESNLLCQMAADKSLGSRFNNPAAWLDFYRNSLGKLFWKITNFNTVSYPVPSPTRSVSVMGILEHTFFKVLAQPLRHQIEADIELLMELPLTSPASQLYTSKTHVELSTRARSSFDGRSESVISLQISVVHSGSLVSVCSVYFKTAEPVAADVFSQKFKVRDLLGNISVNSFEADLMESSYEGVRQQVKTKLGETNIRENILQITDSPIPVDELPHANAHQFLDGLDI